MSEFEEVAKERLNFVGEETISHINGKKILYFSAAERTERQRHSSTVITGMVLLVIACVGVIFYLKYYMVVQSDNGTVNGLGAMTASILNAVQIQVTPLSASFRDHAFLPPSLPPSPDLESGLSRDGCVADGQGKPPYRHRVRRLLDLQTLRLPVRELLRLLLLHRLHQAGRWGPLPRQLHV
jgi:hypothetical protein